MARVYDSAKLREAARAVRAMRDNLEDGSVKPGYRALQASEPLKGTAAEAMRDRLTQLEDQLRQITGELDSVGVELNRYASALEQAGNKLKQEML